MPTQCLYELCGNDYHFLDLGKPNSESIRGKPLDCFQCPNTL